MTVFDADVPLTLRTPDPDGLGEVVTALREWQRDDAPVQLHPGDLGWFWRLGTDATAAALRIWADGTRPLAIGLLDGADTLRLTVAPDVWRDDALADQVVADVVDPDRGVLPAGTVSVETPDGTRIRERLADAGWDAGEPWTPLRRDLAGPVLDPDLRVEPVSAERGSEYTAVVRSAFGSAPTTDDRFGAMASGIPFADAACLFGVVDDVVVGAITVWSAGPGRPGLIEPLAVHADHRRRGHGVALCIAGAAALRRLGSSSALVCTPSALTGAVATYLAAGFERLPERLDRTRAA